MTFLECGRLLSKTSVPIRVATRDLKHNEPRLQRCCVPKYSAEKKTGGSKEILYRETRKERKKPTAVEPFHVYRLECSCLARAWCILNKSTHAASNNHEVSTKRKINDSAPTIAITAFTLNMFYFIQRPSRRPTKSLCCRLYLSMSVMCCHAVDTTLCASQNIRRQSSPPVRLSEWKSSCWSTFWMNCQCRVSCKVRDTGVA